MPASRSGSRPARSPSRRSTSWWPRRCSARRSCPLLHEAVQRGELLGGGCARERLGRLHRLSIRLLGDGVLRRRAWDVADELGWASTYDAEYIALTQLQADALRHAQDAEPGAEAVEGLVATASIDALR